jgi:hypothetical protein
VAAPRLGWTHNARLQPSVLLTNRHYTWPARALTAWDSRPNLMIIFSFRVKSDAMGNSDKVVGGMALHKDGRGRHRKPGVANASPPLLFGRRGVRPLLFFPKQGERSAGRRLTAAPCEARRIPCDRDARLSALHLRLSPSALAVAQLRAGFPSAGIGARLVQQAPCRAVLVPPDRGPGAARVLGYEPSPRGPPLLHPPNVSGRRPQRAGTRDIVRQCGWIMVLFF